MTVAVHHFNVPLACFCSWRSESASFQTRRTQITEARNRVGLTDLPMNPHTYRKTVGTEMGRKDIEKAAAQLGHASSTTTRRHYVEPAHEGPDTREYLEDFAEV
ncbi:tyrosine-type recombinase/integrase [Nocardia sp. NPDC005366]|uniref:tyrosine-type recombinase/integrase n=1 Tax=Nocardia sp. NPDC005366 TaxID=3156878 RepID=UPI0033B46A86